jgi:pimeloyl-ACP methyl ester carboxylesterase
MSQSPRSRPWTAAAALLFATALSASAANPFAASRRSSKPSAPPIQLHSPFGITEVGTLSGADYRIDIPNGWNHMLVVYYHGYAQQPVTSHIAERLPARLEPLLERHYAVAQSAYSQVGWALPQAYPETEALRQYFVKRFGSPRETYVAGASMGGALVMVTLELNPKPYIGGLDLCGSVGSTSASFDRRFAIRAAFDYYFPGVMPPLLHVPSDFEANHAERERIATALRENPESAAAMRSLMGLHTDAELASDIAYFTYVIGDMQHRSGGNPFDNRNTIYSGTSATSSAGDYELNDKVRRYAAEPSARAYLSRHYTPTGRLAKPMLAIHTIYDPVVPVSQLAVYSRQVQAAGFGLNLVQQYVHRDGHCNVRPDEVGQAFDELVDWTHGRGRPAAGLLPDLRPPFSLHEQASRSEAEHSPVGTRNSIAR